jgi:hypothetical protein
MKKKSSPPPKKSQDRKRKPYTLPILVKRWEREELTVEQAIGQIFLWLGELVERIQRLEKDRGPRKEAET